VVIRRRTYTCTWLHAGSSPGRSASHNKLFTCTHVPLFTKQYINWYWRKLGAKQVLHATHWLRIRGIAALAGVWLRPIETEISAALGPLWWLGKDFSFSLVPCSTLRCTSCRTILPPDHSDTRLHDIRSLVHQLSAVCTETQEHQQTAVPIRS